MYTQVKTRVKFVYKGQDKGDICQLFITNFNDLFRVKAEGTFVYLGQITCEICILKRSRQGGKLNTCVEAEVKFVYPKFEFLGG